MMDIIIRYKEKVSTIIWSIALTFLLIILGGCNKAPEKIYAIGIPSRAPIDIAILEGFRERMVELGYIEGVNIKYLYERIDGNEEKNTDSAIKELLARDIDILLTIEPNVSLRAKELVKGTDMPVLFGVNPYPVQNKLVDSLKHPGGNLTGVRDVDLTPKALEWLVAILPDAEKIYLPYDSDFVILATDLPELNRSASRLGIEIIPHEIHSVEQVVEAINVLPDDIDAIFLIPSPTLDPRSIELSRAALNRGIPVGSSILLDEMVLVTFTNDFWGSGRKTAWLAHQIFKGIKPADLPVEESEVSLIINLKMAEKLGIKIPDDILLQTNTIIR